MNDLLKIETHEGKETVNARELHSFLEVGKDFSNWIKDRIEKFGFNEGQDYTVIDSPKLADQNGRGGDRRSKDYFLSLDMAKELSMVENNDKGRQARLYFIEVEKRAREFAEGPGLLARAVLTAQKVIEDQTKLITEMKPKADYYDAVAGSKSAIPMGIVAKEIDFEGIGRNHLFAFLREHDVLMSDNVPYQDQIDAGRFRVIEQKYTAPSGETRISCTTLVHPRGVQYIVKLLEKAGYRKRGEKALALLLEGAV